MSPALPGRETGLQVYERGQEPERSQLSPALPGSETRTKPQGLQQNVSVAIEPRPSGQGDILDASVSGASVTDLGESQLSPALPGRETARVS